MYQCKVDKRENGGYVLVATRPGGWSSDGILMGEDEAKMLLDRILAALDGRYPGNLSQGDFCRFLYKGPDQVFVLSVQVIDGFFRGYEMNRRSLLSLRASLKNALAEE